MRGSIQINVFPFWGSSGPIKSFVLFFIVTPAPAYSNFQALRGLLGTKFIIKATLPYQRYC